MKYRHLFFDLDHTLWDFDANAKLTLAQLYHDLELEKTGVHDFELFYQFYLVHNDKLWARFRNGYIKAEELRWKRMWHTLLEFKTGDEKLAKVMGLQFLQHLPSRSLLFPDAVTTLKYLQDKGYNMHLITNGFEETQHHKLKNSAIDHFFIEVITSEGSNSIKPKKEIFDYALKKARAEQHHSIMIGDSIEVDIQGAINAGIDQVHVNHINAKSTLRPTFTVRSLKELQEIF
ncbi:MAG: noncanonical pyrimidine nucleotidase, YjjG family [Chitinophagaceae bacterium]|nr:noncanonical pyrimidine nucleotidase, YjjG family [Chitinophagaceae bacterium]